MSTIELRKKLIERIQETDNKRLLEEAYRLLEMEIEELEVYKLSDEQKMAVNESREQIRKGSSLTNEQANSDIEEWLEK
jgi:hypothetical protein